VTGSCEHDNELSGSVKGREICWRAKQLLVSQELGSLSWGGKIQISMCVVGLGGAGISSSGRKFAGHTATLSQPKRYRLDIL